MLSCSHMESSASFSSRRLIVLFVLVGLFGGFALMSVPFLIGSHAAREAQRYLDCQEKKRADCEPSFLWQVYFPNKD